MVGHEAQMCDPLRKGCPALTDAIHTQDEKVAGVAAQLRTETQQTAATLATKHETEIQRLYERLNDLFDTFNARLNSIMQWVAVTALSAAGALLIYILTKLIK